MACYNCIQHPYAASWPAIAAYEVLTNTGLGSSIWGLVKSNAVTTKALDIWYQNLCDKEDQVPPTGRCSNMTPSQKTECCWAIDDKELKGQGGLEVAILGIVICFAIEVFLVGMVIVKIRLSRAARERDPERQTLVPVSNQQSPQTIDSYDSL